ncbi:MAG: UDP-N-acetylmuramoyl-L-alanine--D-glutamate ligase [Pseudomonadota bacterium]
MSVSSHKPDLSGMKVVVVGLAKTGQAAVEFLVRRGARVIGTDLRPWEDLPAQVKALTEQGAILEVGGHKIETFTQADLIVVSPGVPPTIEPLQRARDRGTPITGELELASRFVDIPLVAVTGSNGKTTTTSLIGEIFRAAGRKVFVGGNIGAPLIGFVSSGEPADVAVVEVSSFQLETTETFCPDTALLLNATPDHLDRHAGFEEYLRLKARVFERQGPEHTAILNADDPAVMGLEVKARRLLFSRKTKPCRGACVENGRLMLLDDGRELGGLPVRDLTLVGAHNQENVMAAGLAALTLGVSPEIVLGTAARFKGLPHRVELVGSWRGVSYYDDSKGTNVGAVIKSLEGFDAPVILIAGGKDKAGDFAPLGPIAREKVKLLILLGEAREKMAAALSRHAETVLAATMEDALVLARDRAVAGDVVLLSPACASFDMFEDYAHRGRVFARWAEKVNA